jgi:hypothetical protein
MPRSTRRQPFVDPRDQQIEDLKRELYRARDELLGTLPYELRRELDGYYRVSSRKEGREWLARKQQELAEAAEVISESEWDGPRAACPVCGATGSSPYTTGYRKPEGVWRHLVGHGNTHECPIMRTLRTLAEEYWDREFADAEQEEHSKEEAALQQRRATELLYRAGPDHTPELREHLNERSFWRHRDDKDLEWAEARLQSLGFEVRTQNRVREYIREYAGVTVYADPLTKGRISMHAYKKPVLKRHAQRKYDQNFARFSIYDYWKNDLQDKFEQALESAAKWITPELIAAPMDTPTDTPRPKGRPTRDDIRRWLAKRRGDVA